MAVEVAAQRTGRPGSAPSPAVLDNPHVNSARLIPYSATRLPPRVTVRE